ncbi:HAAS signaling domain-containing protein [Nonomuraea sp. NPDC050022]|uniref:HAAS signaling domain-containing protein n=1 Tax=Nonomuraea sp. NPDC050022 TaxID=3364358 RepID=UPI0037AC94F7
MNRSTDPLDRLVEDYLAEVAYATAGLSAARREDLLADLREHITVARADLDPPTQAGIRTILDRLGDPAAIAEEAHLGEPAPTASTGASPHASPHAATMLRPSAVRPRRSPGRLALVLVSVLVVILVVVGACAVTFFASSSESGGPAQVSPSSR